MSKSAIAGFVFRGKKSGLPSFKIQILCILPNQTLLSAMLAQCFFYRIKNVLLVCCLLFLTQQLSAQQKIYEQLNYYRLKADRFVID